MLIIKRESIAFISGLLTCTKNARRDHLLDLAGDPTTPEYEMNKALREYRLVLSAHADFADWTEAMLVEDEEEPCGG